VLEEVFVELLLLSSSATHGTGFLEHALPAVADWLDGRDRLLFIPCAKRDGDAYLQVVRSAVAPLGVAVDGLHQEPDPVAALRRAAALFVGGGNTFRLLSALQRTGLVEVIRERVQEGMPYLGASAGTNVACPSLRTSNDMPIVPPASFEALGLVPFQINPHYVDPDPRSTHLGETRDERIAEFLEENDVPVLGVREGSWLRISGDQAVLGGQPGARLFTRNAPVREVAGGEDLSFLLTSEPRYDCR
jgi:dipeptidase E